MKKISAFVLTVFFVSIFLFSCGGGASSGGNSPSKAVEKLFDYIKSKNYDKATSMFYLEEGKELSDAEAQKIKALLMAADEEYQKKDGIKDVEILSEKVDENGVSGKVAFKVIYGNGDDDEQSYNLKKIDGDWKLQAISGF